MGGAAGVGTMTQRAQQALAAGCDLLLVCNDRPGTLELLKNLKPQPRPESSRRLQRLFRKLPRRKPRPGKKKQPKARKK